MEDRLRATKRLDAADVELLWDAKQCGFSDRQLATLWRTTDLEVRRVRKAKGVEPVFKLVDTCAAEFEAFTPYYYSAYERPVHAMVSGEGAADRGRAKTYSRTRPASATFRQAPDHDPRRRPQPHQRPGDRGSTTAAASGGGLGLRARRASMTIHGQLLNPETVSTDYDTSDHLFFEPLTVEVDVLNICDRVKFPMASSSSSMRPDAAQAWPGHLRRPGSADPGHQRRFDRHRRESRTASRCSSTSCILKQLRRTARRPRSARRGSRRLAARSATLVLVRPSYVLGGRAMEIIYDEDLDEGLIVNQAPSKSLAGKPILIEGPVPRSGDLRSTSIASRTAPSRAVIGGVPCSTSSEAGIHSGDLGLRGSRRTACRRPRSSRRSRSRRWMR